MLPIKKQAPLPVAAPEPSSAPLRPKSGGLGAKLLILISSIALSLIGFEILFRFLAPSLTTAVWSDRPREWYVPEGSGDQRNQIFSKSKPAGTYRVVVIGDSFTFAGKVQYDDNFAKRLERMLNLNLDHPRAEVLNWGIPGYSTEQEVPLVRKAVGEYGADLVVLEITLNDPEVEPYHSSHAALYAWEKRIQRSPIFTYWHSLQFFAQRILNTFRNREYVSYHQQLFEKPETWRSFSNALEKTRKASKDSSVPVIAMVFPMLSHPFDERYPFRAAHEKIKARLAELEIPDVDLLPNLLGIPPERLQAKPGADAHPNEIAHRIASDTLYEFLKSHNYLPPPLVIKETRQQGRRLPKTVVAGREVGAKDSSTPD